MAINVSADPIVLTLDAYFTASQYPPAPRNSALDGTFDCRYEDAIPEITISLEGDWLNKSFNKSADPIIITLTLLGGLPGGNTGFVVAADPIYIYVTLKGEGDLDPFPPFHPEALKSNLIRWSDIGHLDFTINRGNVAGERRVDWAGWIYAIKKLRDKVVVYGENGVSILTPSGNAYGLNTIYRIGLKSKQAVTGNDTVHYFIDNEGQLFSLDDSLHKLDYSEYLSIMSSPVMSYDAENDLVYICDGTYGYVYSPKDKSLGRGPINITGIFSQNGVLYVVSPATIVIPVFEICTDIYDLETRENKIISSVKIGTETTKVLSVAIDYRTDKAEDFIQSSWYETDKEGKVFFPCYGCEFRFRIKTDAYEYFELDYIEIKGNVNIAERRPLEWEKVYAIERLGERIVTYGDGGIIILPLEDGDQTIYEMELKGKNAVGGTESAQYFIDIKGQLWSITDTLKLLDYSEYLSSMENNLVMSYDVENDLIYICDGILGYVYSPKSNSLGKGPTNITGIGSQGGVLYAVAPAAIATPTFEICTDIYDLGTRNFKTVYSIEVGTDLTEYLQASVDFRVSNKGPFTTLGWHLVNPSGVAYIPCYGVEFRFRLKALSYEYLEIDYLIINGFINDYSHTKHGFK
ncbi:hypothetical protein KAX02_13675 [candidate division WOR-3 bacterium]|nr:hypothetical protein [candidate division WOR-3 bacterium]